MVATVTGSLFCCTSFFLKLLRLIDIIYVILVCVCVLIFIISEYKIQFFFYVIGHFRIVSNTIIPIYISKSPTPLLQSLESRTGCLCPLQPMLPKGWPSVFDYFSIFKAYAFWEGTLHIFRISSLKATAG